MLIQIVGQVLLVEKDIDVWTHNTISISKNVTYDKLIKSKIINVVHFSYL